MSESYRFVVAGRVQGVFFRESTRRRADELRLCGWVCNRPDGTVEGRVSGTDATALDAFRLWLHRGPERAQVQSVQWTPSPDTLAQGFEVRR
jgi:acylphosphatase